MKRKAVGGICAAKRRPHVRRRILSGEKVMLKKLVTKLIKDEQGGEVLEYALIAGLIVVAAIAVIGSVGTKVLARWQAIDAGL
jgi:Flp pilus assembly pilin Flp